MSQFYIQDEPSGGGSTVQVYQNLGLDYTSGRLSVVQADGSTLTSSAYGRVRTPIKGSLGLEQIIQVNKPYKLDDDAHATIHDMEGWYPFWDSGDNWDSPRPYFLYLIIHDTATSDPVFAISQCPCYRTAPAASAINVSGTINSNTQESMFLFQISDGAGGWTTPTIANYDGNPCVCLGSVRLAVSDTSNDDQTFQALVGTDGFGQFQEGVVFQVPFQNQVIGSYSTFFAVNPGTGGNPTWTSGSVAYTIKRDGTVDVQSEWNILTSASTNTSELFLLLPYYIRGLSGDKTIGAAFDSSGSVKYSVVADPTGGQRTINNIRSSGATSDYLYNTFQSNDNFGFRYQYQAFVERAEVA